LGVSEGPLVDLAPPRQELATALPVVPTLLPRCGRGDVQVLDPHLAVLHPRVGLGERRTTLPERLHLGAAQHESGFEPLLDLIVVARLPVRRDDLLARVSSRAHTSRKRRIATKPARTATTTPIASRPTTSTEP